MLHPLVHRNCSTFDLIRFATALSDIEFNFHENVLTRQKQLPSVAFLEMVRVANSLAQDRCKNIITPLEIQKLTWTSPITDDLLHREIHIELKAKQNGVEFETCTRLTSEKRQVMEGQLHCQGWVVSKHIDCYSIDNKGLAHNLAHLKSRCQLEQLSGLAYHGQFGYHNTGFDSDTQCIQQLKIGQDEVLAEISISAEQEFTSSLGGIHPNLIDAAIQASNYLFDPSYILLPIELYNFIVYKACSDHMWAWTRLNDSTENGNY